MTVVADHGQASVTHDPNDHGPCNRIDRMLTACRSCLSLFSVVAVSRPAGCARQLLSCALAASFTQTKFGRPTRPSVY
jgi:hypothetical protein